MKRGNFSSNWLVDCSNGRWLQTLCALFLCELNAHLLFVSFFVWSFIFPRRGGICICVLYFQTRLSTWNCPPLPMNGYGHKIRPRTPTPTTQKDKTCLHKMTVMNQQGLIKDNIQTRNEWHWRQRQWQWQCQWHYIWGKRAKFCKSCIKMPLFNLKIRLFDEKSFFVCYQALFVCLSLPGTWTFL